MKNMKARMNKVQWHMTKATAAQKLCAIQGTVAVGSLAEASLWGLIRNILRLT